MSIIFFICVLIAIFLNNYMGAYLGFTSLVITTCGPLFIWSLVYLLRYSNTRVRKDVIYNRSIVIIIYTLIAILFKYLVSQPEFIREYIIFTIIPSVFIITFNSLPDKYIRYLRISLIGMFILECLLSIVERIRQKIFFSNEDVYSMINKEEDVWSFRSSSLFGHPIANSMVVIIITVFILFSDIKYKNKLFLLALSLGAQLCFNTRAGIILTVFILLYFVFSTLKRHSFLSKILLFVSLFFIFSLLYNLMMEYNLGGRLFNISDGFFNDESSNARFEAFDFYKYLSNNELLYGSLDLYDRLLVIMNLVGIENGFIAIILKYGLILGVVMIFLFLFLHISMLKKSYSIYQILLILLVFYGYGMTNPHLSNSTVWYIFIYSYFSLRPTKKNLIYERS